MVDCACNHFPTGSNVTIADRLGVGTTTPAQKLHAHGPVAALPETSGVNQTGILRLAQTFGPGVLDFGFGGDGYGWLQATLSNSLGSSQGLLLNPNGGSVGIGTTAPGRPLQVGAATGTRVGMVRLAGSTPGVGSRTWDVGPDPNGSPAHSFAITDVTAGAPRLVIKGDGSGNVGIGTAAPLSRLDVRYDTPTPTAHGLRLENTNTTAGATSDLNLLVYDGANHLGARIYVTGDAPRAWTDYRLTFATQAVGGDTFVDALTLKNANVGVGTTNPLDRLHVNGNIRAEGTIYTTGQLDISAGGDVRAGRKLIANNHVVADEAGRVYGAVYG